MSYSRLQESLQGIHTMTRDSTHDYDNYMGLMWDNKLAVQRVYQYTAMLDRDPDCVVDRKGGYAIWEHVRALDKGVDGEYLRIEIRDRSYQHMKPERHSDFLFTTIIMPLNADKYPELSKISESGFYYPIGQELTAGCHFLEASIATFAIIKGFNDGEYNVEEARERYNTTIKELMMETKEWEAAKREDNPQRDAYERYIFS